MGTTSGSTISRRAFLAGAPVALLAAGALASDPDPAEKMPLRPRITDVPSHLWPYVDPEVRYQRVELPTEQNAYPLLQKAVKELAPFDRFLKRAPYNVATLYDSPIYTAYEKAERGGTFPDGEAADAIRKWIEANEAATKNIDRAIARGRFQIPTEVLLGFVDGSESMNELDPYDNISSFRLMRARLRISEGDHAAAAADIVSVLRFGQMVAEADGLLIHRTIGQEIQREGLDLAASMARNETVLDGALNTLAIEVPRYVPSPKSYKRVLRAELCYATLSLLDQLSERSLGELVDRCVDLCIWGGGSENRLRFSDHIRRNLDDARRGLLKMLDGHPRAYDKLETVRLMSKLTVEEIRDLGHPYHARRRDIGSDIAKEVAAWPAGLSLTNPFYILDPTRKPIPDAEVERARSLLQRVGNPVGKHLAVGPRVFEPRRTVELNRATFAATRLILALRQYADLHHRLPETLDALVDEKLLDRVPLDPFAGKPFSYSAKRGILWSYGTDEKDDGGDWNFETKAGKDLVWKLPIVKPAER